MVAGADVFTGVAALEELVMMAPMVVGLAAEVTEVTAGAEEPADVAATEVATGAAVPPAPLQRVGPGTVY